MPAGRRAYKTETAKRTLILGDRHHRGALTTPGGRFFAAAPTADQARRIYWDDLKALTRLDWAKLPHESRMILYLKCKGGGVSEIHVLGMDKPSRIEGAQWHGGIMDEYADMKATAWPNHVQPVTADTGAWVNFIGVPEGRNHYHNLYMYARQSGDAEWSGHTWKSAAVLPPERIAAARRMLDPRTFVQEYEASFELTGGRAYYAYDDIKNALRSLPFRPDLPTYMTWDFNAGKRPMSVNLVQQYGDRYHVPKGFSHTFTNTNDMCEIVKGYLTDRGFHGQLKVTGDHAGMRAESNASFSDYEIIEWWFRGLGGYTREDTRPTISIRDRVASTNALFCNALMERHLTVDPNEAPELTYDLLNVQFMENGVKLDDRSGLTDPSDSLSYFAYYYHGIDFKAAKIASV